MFCFSCSHSASTGTVALYVETWAVASYDVQHATVHALPLTHQVFQAAAHSLMNGMSLCILHKFIPVLETSPKLTPTKANTSVGTAGQILPWIWARRNFYFFLKIWWLNEIFKYAVPEYTYLWGLLEYAALKIMKKASSGYILSWWLSDSRGEQIKKKKTTSKIKSRPYSL